MCSPEKILLADLFTARLTRLTPPLNLQKFVLFQIEAGSTLNLNLNLHEADGTFDLESWNVLQVRCVSR